MRLAHHLHRNACGVFCFRLIVPKDLQPLLGVKVYRRSLRTRDPAQARLYAYQLALSYAELVANSRGEAVAGPKVSDVLKALDGNAKAFEIVPSPHGYAIKTDGTAADNAAALEALGKLSQIVPASAPGRRVAPLKLSEAIGRWLTKVQPETLKDTLNAKRDAVAEFRLWKGDVELSSIGSTDLDEYRAFLQEKGNSLPTLRNKFTYIGQMFDWAMTAGYYPDAKNPAVNQVKYGAKQKRARRANAWQPFSEAQLTAIFDPANYERHKLPTEYWTPLIQLYTGARVTEVCQLAVADFVVEDGLKCIRITDDASDDDGEGLKKRTKTPGSVRTLPIHPVLIDLGLLDYVALRRKTGDAQLFPYLLDGANGVGDRQLKAFGRYLDRLNIKATGAGRIGSHSFRKTVAGMLQGANVRLDVACKYTGHEVPSVHVQNYNDYKPASFARLVLPHLNYPIAIEKLKRSANSFERAIIRATAKNAEKQKKLKKITA